MQSQNNYIDVYVSYKCYVYFYIINYKTYNLVHIPSVQCRISNEKLLYVIDKGNHRVQVFQPNNTFVFSFGDKGLGPGEFQSPVILAFDPNNNALVNDCKVDCTLYSVILASIFKKLTVVANYMLV